MIKMKRISAFALASLMALSAVACAKEDPEQTSAPTSGGNNNETQGGDDTPDPTKAPTQPGVRDIYVGTWFDVYYTSAHHAIEDNPSYGTEEKQLEQAQMQLDNMRAIEEKYNVRLFFENMTWTGTMESISTSIMSGKPDADIYMADLQFGIPAVLSGYAVPVTDFAAADSDIFNEQTVMKFLHIDGSDQDYLISPSGMVLDSYLLGFNMDMIKNAGLENPQDLWDRGEWTWDKFREYLNALTVDEDMDGSIDVYGYAGWWTNFLNQMLMANGAAIAAGPTSTLDDPKVLEVLEFVDTIYNVDHTARPWDESDWNVNNTQFIDQKAAFWIAAAWVMANNNPVDDGGYAFEFGIVPFPIGPSGDQETNKTYMVAGNWYFIANGVEDPELVYNVFFDWNNWYDYDISIRDDNQWFVDSVTSPYAADPLRNFGYLEAMGKKTQLDIWGSLSVFSLNELMNQTYTPAQLVETYKEAVQTALDSYFAK